MLLKMSFLYLVILFAYQLVMLRKNSRNTWKSFFIFPVICVDFQGSFQGSSHCLRDLRSPDLRSAVGRSEGLGSGEAVSFSSIIRMIVLHFLHFHWICFYLISCRNRKNELAVRFWATVWIHPVLLNTTPHFYLKWKLLVQLEHSLL